MQEIENEMNPENSSRPVSSQNLAETSATLQHILDEMGKVIVGQEHMNRSLLIGLITGGHILLEGLPGLAKTLAVRTLAEVLDSKFQRIQFTPDLLPSDLIGTMIYEEKTKSFVPKKGPIFTNIILADEINRAPAKVQSALLEAMAEHQVTIGDTTYALEEPFLVLATQNPIEQEGTYNLPEAQLDRFLFKVRVGYPKFEEERMILERMANSQKPKPNKIINADTVLKFRKQLDSIYLDERIKQYILRLVMSTRKNESLDADSASADKLKEIRAQLQIGASPRATIALCQTAKANALFEQRDYVTPDDVKSVTKEIFRHRLILTFEAEAKNTTTDDVIDQILETIYVP